MNAKMQTLFTPNYNRFVSVVVTLPQPDIFPNAWLSSWSSLGLCCLSFTDFLAAYNILQYSAQLRKYFGASRSMCRHMTKNVTAVRTKLPNELKEVKLASRFSTLRPSGYYMYHHALTPKKFYFLPTQCVCVFLYGSQNKQRLFLYKVLTDRFL